MILAPSELPRMVAFGHIGKTVILKIIRKGNPAEIKAVIEIKPEKQ